MDIAEIFEMLDWNMPTDVQARGISYAKAIGTIAPFIQPLTPKYSKNVWDNCALIIAEERDEALTPHLLALLEWLQDMNHPGAFCILNRLEAYEEHDCIREAINTCLEYADEIWKENLLILLKKHSRKS